MPTRHAETRISIGTATLAAGAMIAQQTAGKAMRDAFFLSNFAIQDLPAMVVAAALVSIGVALGMSRLLTRQGPSRVVPGAFAASAALVLLEWGLSGVWPGAIAVVFYLHVAAFGAVLISTFWSLIGERFDPHTAKQMIGRIGAGATLGGVVGGVFAERAASQLTITAVFPMLAALHVVCALATRRLVAPDASKRPAQHTGEVERMGSGFRILGRTPYLRQLGLLVLTGTLTAGFLDYVFKAEAVQSYHRGEALLRFFAIFYTAVAVLTFVVQALTSRRSLEKLGLARTVAWLPGLTGLGALAGLALPGLPAMAAARGGESVVRSSLYRSAYEILFTPIAPREKRASKTLIDVGVERLGDALGGAVVSVVLLAAPAAVSPLLMAMAAGLSAGTLWLTSRLHRGYVRALEQSLLTRAADLDLEALTDSTTRSTVLQTLGTLDLDRAMRELSLSGGPEVLRPGPRSLLVDRAGERRAAAEPSAEASIPPDPLLGRIVDLRSADPPRVQTALQAGPLHAALVPHVIPLLAWDAVCHDAVAALRGVAERVTGQLLDALLDPDEEFTVRRRLPRVLAWARTQRSVDGLLAALSDPRFEVRFQCGRALAYLAGKKPGLVVPSARVFECVEREAQVERRVWDSHRLLDRPEEEEDDSPFADELLRQRVNRSLEHVFTLLALVLPRQALTVAFRGLHTTDPGLRGTALEYLESVLPATIRERLWPFLEAPLSGRAPAAERGDPLDRLMRSDRSIQLNLEALRALPAKDGGGVPG